MCVTQWTTVLIFVTSMRSKSLLLLFFIQLHPPNLAPHPNPFFNPKLINWNWDDVIIISSDDEDDEEKKFQR